MHALQAHILQEATNMKAVIQMKGYMHDPLAANLLRLDTYELKNRLMFDSSKNCLKMRLHAH